MLVPPTISAEAPEPFADAAATADDAQANEIKRAAGTFLACLNHEIRTPLSGIMGMVDLLLETPLDEEQKDYVNAARLCAENLFALLNATLEFSALEAGQITLDENEFCLREMLDAALAPFRPKAEAKGLKLYLTVESNIPETMLGDAPRLKELLGHVLSNGVKFTETGSVELRVSFEHRAAGNSEKQDWVKFSVRDTGVGIDPERLPSLFQSFRQGETGLSRQYSGLGLGLALARKMTELMHGRITAQSQPGLGSTFTIEVPLRAVQAVPADPVVDTGDTPSAGPWILAVDDNPVGLKVLCHFLERRKYQVFCVQSGSEAIQAARSKNYDIILMDLQMPEMDGLTAAAELRKVPGYENTPILALTANFSDQVREECRAHGMQAFLSKPIEAEELWAALARYSRRHAK
jgi:CheY-like chemotaxis protein/nitrogen-specific signal transduction histidine kinase